MRDFFAFRNWRNWRNRKTATVFSAGILALSLAGVVQAQSRNQAGESANATATAKGKADDSSRGQQRNKGEKVEKKSSKQNAGGNSANYHGAQPPQGGRLGQGPE
jgi:basic membrane lipoprotein Med (substrate-binding protein (PBP1-ABC) superfamily)